MVKESRSVVDRISEIISPILWTLGLELADVVCVGQGSRSVVRVFIDKPEGVTLDDCERAHKALGPALDVADPFPHAYTLEVSSPGLDRPFKRIQDYRRAIGKRVTLKLREVADRCCGGRIVSMLEGGYDRQGLATGVAAHVTALMG